MTKSAKWYEKKLLLEGDCDVMLIKKVSITTKAPHLSGAKPG